MEASEKYNVVEEAKKTLAKQLQLLDKRSAEDTPLPDLLAISAEIREIANLVLTLVW